MAPGYNTIAESAGALEEFVVNPTRPEYSQKFERLIPKITNLLPGQPTLRLEEAGLPEL